MGLKRPCPPGNKPPTRFIISCPFVCLLRATPVALAGEGEETKGEGRYHILISPGFTDSIFLLLKCSILPPLYHFPPVHSATVL